MSVPEKLIAESAEMILDNDKLREVMKKFRADVDRGLAKATHDSAIVKCFVTYVQDLPNGTEKGKFLALDVGGTNFRVLLVELADKKCDITNKTFKIPEPIMVGCGEKLFDYIAESLSTFIHENKLEKQTLPLGFTFSFPVMQKGLSKGILERWTKGFNCAGVIGNDVVQLLRGAITRRKDIEVGVIVILNDTTGTLMSCAWKNHNCKIGLIIGTGTNACYVEKQKVAELFDEPDNGSGMVIINTEWGAFGDDGALDFIRTSIDVEVDTNSINPKRQLHEKMISGMYMGEMIRLYLCKFTSQGLILDKKHLSILQRKDCFPSDFASKIEADPTGVYTNCRDCMNSIGLKDLSDQDCVNIKYVCELVSRRAAHLVSAGLSAILNKIDFKNVTIGIDGALYRNHPHFHNLMMTKIKELANKDIVFSLMLSEDGSGRGAALVAAVAARVTK